MCKNSVYSMAINIHSDKRPVYMEDGSMMIYPSNV